MNFKNHILTLFTISFLAFSTLAVVIKQPIAIGVGEATLTGTIYDRGEDTDANGKFNNLIIDVEISVAVSGTYMLEAYSLGDGYGYGYYYSYAHSQSYLDSGLQRLNLSFYGPEFCSAHFSPQNVSIDLYLVDGYPPVFMNGIYDVAFSKTYNYSEFDSPLKDMQTEFMVYPNATIIVNGSMNHTHMYPLDEGPKFNASIGFTTSGTTTSAHVNGTFTPPESDASEFPLDATTASMLVQYYNDILDAQFNATVLTSSADTEGSPFNTTAGDAQMTAQYADGMLNVDANGVLQLSPEFGYQYPFNISDLTLKLDYANKKFDGNATFHTVAGFPLGDVIVNINGNETYISLDGYLNVVYGNYPEFELELNETTFEEMLADFNSSLIGQGDRSVYNMTDGFVECTTLNTIKTPWDYGARVDFNAALQGNFTAALAHMMVQYAGDNETEPIIFNSMDSVFSSVQNASLTLNYYNASRIVDFNLHLCSNVNDLWNMMIESLPPAVPPETQTQVDAWLRIANATAYAISNAEIQAVYSAAEQKLSINASLTANVSQLEQDAIPYLPYAVPPELQQSFESFLDTTYADLTSLTLSVNYTNGSGEFSSDCIFEGSFSDEVNHAKSFFIELAGMVGPSFGDWETRLLNGTHVDVDNFHAKISEGNDWMCMQFADLRIYPSADQLDFIRFKLNQWLNSTSSIDAPPREFEKFKVTISAGFNGTHTVLLYAPGSMPHPDNMTLDYKRMTWENSTMDSLKDLLFQIAFQGVVNHIGNTYYVPIFTNSTVSNFGFDAYSKTLSFNVTGNSGTGFCNITIPRALLYASNTSWTVTLDTIPVAYSVEENAEFVFIYLDYTHSNHAIQVTGTWVVTEYQPPILLLAITAACILVSTLAIKQRKKLGTFKAKYESALSAFATKIRQLRN